MTNWLIAICQRETCIIRVTNYSMIKYRCQRSFGAFEFLFIVLDCLQLEETHAFGES